MEGETMESRSVVVNDDCNSDDHQDQPVWCEGVFRHPIIVILVPRKRWIILLTWKYMD